VLKITLRRSLIGYEKSQRLTANALGLGKVGSSVVQQDSSPIRGMVRKLRHVLSVETIEAAPQVAAEEAK
jgi:large subunit ribosomal protein L30